MYPISAQADLQSMYGGVKQTITTEALQPLAPEKRICPVCPTTPFSEIQRADIDVDFRFNILDNPGDGRYDFYIGQNYDVQVNYNLTPAFMLGPRTRNGFTQDNLSPMRYLLTLLIQWVLWAESAFT